jgi:protein TonB
MVDLSLRAVPAVAFARPGPAARRGVGLLEREPGSAGSAPEGFALAAAPDGRLEPTGSVGIQRIGWALALGLHAAVAASAWIGLPLKQPEAWPAGAFVVTLLFEPRKEEVAETAPPTTPDPLLAQLPPAPSPPEPPVLETEVAPVPSPPEPLLAQLPPVPSLEAKAAPFPPAPDPLLAQLLAVPPPPEPPTMKAEALPTDALPADLPHPRAKPAPPAAQLAPGPRSSAQAETQATAQAGSTMPPPQIAAMPMPLVPPRPVSAAVGNRKPAYPAEARRRHLEGLVVLQVAVSARGTPDDVAVLKSSGHALLDDAALAAVRLWRFEPATRGGIAVPAPAEVPVRFRLED